MVAEEMDTNLGIAPLMSPSKCTTRRQSERRHSIVGVEAESTTVLVDQERLQCVLKHVLNSTEGFPLIPLLDLHAQLNRIVQAHSGHMDRRTLPQVRSNIDRNRGCKPLKF